jgi:hypothetical protein
MRWRRSVEEGMEVMEIAVTETGADMLVTVVKGVVVMTMSSLLTDILVPFLNFRLGDGFVEVDEQVAVDGVSTSFDMVGGGFTISRRDRTLDRHRQSHRYRHQHHRNSYQRRRRRRRRHPSAT